MKIRLYSKGGETVVKYAQKKSTKFVKIVNTSLCVHDTIINVKTPQYIIYFYYPHSKIPSPKRQQNDGCLFFTLFYEKGSQIFIIYYSFAKSKFYS